jgi:tetratricopeptide (TPR) repeat protein
MKKSYFYTASLTLIVAAAIALFFYNKTRQEAPIPQLLERQGPISTTSEWLNTKAAINGLQRKLRDKPNDVKSRLLLALAYMQEARVTGEHPYYYPAALELIEEVIDRKPADESLYFEALVAKATVQLSLHQFEEAMKTGQEALKINTSNASVYGVLCDANVELGNYEEAINMADQMVSLRPDLRSYSRISYLREIHGDMPGAIEAMKLAVDAGYPGLEQTAWARVTLGNLYEKTGDLQLAEMQYRRAMTEYPQYAFAQAGLGRLEAKKKNYKEAIDLFTKASKTIPEFSFQEELVHLYKETGKNRDAEKTLEELLEGLKEDEEAGHIVDLELANIYLDLKGDTGTALKYAMKEYKRRPDNIDVCRTMATIYYKKQDYNQAASFLQKASRTNSQDATLLCLNGLVTYKKGNREQGEELIRKSLYINPFQNNSLSAEGNSIVSAKLSKL